jgi:hypothetical protein
MLANGGRKIPQTMETDSIATGLITQVHLSLQGYFHISVKIINQIKVLLTSKMEQSSSKIFMLPYKYNNTVPESIFPTTILHFLNRMKFDEEYKHSSIFLTSVHCWNPIYHALADAMKKS